MVQRVTSGRSVAGIFDRIKVTRADIFLFADDGTVKAAKRGSAADRMLEDFDLKRQWLSRRRRLNIEAMVRLLNEAVRLFEVGHKAEAKRLARVLLGNIDRPDEAYSIALTQCFWRAWKSACPGERI